MSNTPARPYQVMVVDDSAVIRGLLMRELEKDSRIKVVQSLPNGREAVNAITRQPVDVVVLDIDMPVMDGMTALPLLLEARPLTRILICSTLSQRNADISLRALEHGASDYVPKPGKIHGADAESFYQELLRKVIGLGASVRQEMREPAPPAPVVEAGKVVVGNFRSSSAGAVSAPSVSTPAPPASSSNAIALRPIPPAFKPQALVIGSSTGGPQALFQVIQHFKGVKQPIFLTQHMPPNFTTILAEHITKQTGVAAKEAQHGDIAEPGKILLAPGGYHMLIQRNGTQLKAVLDESPPENFCRPAVDPMLRSLISAVGKDFLVLILTGMGQDGLKGTEQLVNMGGVCVAQDAATSVVWGMPGAVAQAGLCSAVLPIGEIGSFINKILAR